MKGMTGSDMQFCVREVNTMAHLSSEGGHPYLVRFRECFRIKPTEHLVIIMDFCDGGDLERLVETAKHKRQSFSEQQIQLWLLQLLSATDFLHSRQVLHRDIKVN